MSKISYRKILFYPIYPLFCSCPTPPCPVLINWSFAPPRRKKGIPARLYLLEFAPRLLVVALDQLWVLLPRNWGGKFLVMIFIWSSQNPLLNTRIIYFKYLFLFGIAKAWWSDFLCWCDKQAALIVDTKAQSPTILLSWSSLDLLSSCRDGKTCQFKYFLGSGATLARCYISPRRFISAKMYVFFLHF